MTTVALFHSVLGVREGIRDAETRLVAAGHDVVVVDQYEGRSFDDYAEAGALVDSIGFPVLMQRAVDAVADLPDGFAVLGFSNGGGMATWVATQRRVSGAVLASGALPLAQIGVDAWPAGVRAQLHYAAEDPFLVEGSVPSVLGSITAAGAVAEYHQYPGTGHLFTDAGLLDEYDPTSAEHFWRETLRFLAAL